jgi:hypothetical protein
MTHPITPPPELVQRLLARFHTGDTLEATWAMAAQWGADQELEACVGWLGRIGYFDSAHDLRAARRPKPPTLKEQALKTLQRLSKDGFPCNYQEDSDWDTIRRALEALPE